MRLPEKPNTLDGLDLMKRLKAYAMGEASWHANRRVLGGHERSVCDMLYASLSSFVTNCLHPLMDRITAREMQSFTMHDRNHGLKVAHLMWHISREERQESLTPAEIALLITSAHIHDLGMGLSQDERNVRLAPSSDLWDKIDPDSAYSKALSRLSEIAGSGSAADVEIKEALYQVNQAQEALLCIDCRDRHATRERYAEILEALSNLHKIDPTKIIDLETALSFDGDSFKEKLIEICVSHNEDAHVLVDPDPRNIDQARFPTRYPVGCCSADVRLVASSLRLADILDFDRERTPAILFHYLLPQSGDPSENVSVREWSKHLAISNWEIGEEKITFRGRSATAFMHHVISEFSHSIEDEIRKTKSIYPDSDWPFHLRPNVEAVIEAVGYRYIPYRFTLDEQRIYELLMGRNIYDDRLAGIRELIQNAVDACRLRDALMLSYDRSVIPSVQGRIMVKYQEPNSSSLSKWLTVSDSGIGMDRYIIENFFLKVGQSYYSSGEFLRTRSLLRQQGLDFNPVAEFGIGVMAAFMLGDRMIVETAPWSLNRQDNQRRTLQIDGIGRLIEVRETENVGASRFYGTRVSVQLTSRIAPPPTWEEVKEYIQSVCRNLGFTIELKRFAEAEIDSVEIKPEGLEVQVPSHLSKTAFRIPVDDVEIGLRGQIVLYRAAEGKLREAEHAKDNPMAVAEENMGSWSRGRSGILLRGGFAVGHVPGLPEFILTPECDARIEVLRDIKKPRSLPLTNLARTRFNQSGEIAAAVFRIWLGALLDNLEEIETRPIGAPDIQETLLRRATWLERYTAFELYRLSRTSWMDQFKDSAKAVMRIEEWERGEGPSLWCGDQYSRRLDVAIRGVILPKITSVVVGGEGNYYAKPPKTGWEDTLKNWNDFITADMRWPKFADYMFPNEEVFFDIYSNNNFFNAKYESRLDGLSAGDIERLPGVLSTAMAARSYGRQIILSREDASLLTKLEQMAGDLKIVRFDEQASVSQLVRGKVVR